jgi:hypothetical protein
MELQNAINFNSESTMSPRTTNHKSYNWTSNTIQSHTDNMAIYRTSNLSIKMKIVACCQHVMIPKYEEILDQWHDWLLCDNFENNWKCD